jgi:1,2-dihydroxy-3-keto-5-methylthiopentene dioxygenase
MAKLQFRGRSVTEANEIKAILDSVQIPYECWGIKSNANLSTSDNVLYSYANEIDDLKKQRGYETADVIALDPTTPNLEELLAKFSKEHHHTDDEVRFVVGGEGVFEINTAENERAQFTAQPGDLIVVPAWRRHLFYLTSSKTIRCIRLFKDRSGWEAHYPYASHEGTLHKFHFNSPTVP